MKKPANRQEDHCFLRACRGLPHERVPVWFMRQAGRSLPEYRAIRGSGSILDVIAQPDLATEITLQPVRRYETDAAILFSDIMVPAHAIGFGVAIEPGIGPVIEEPFRSAADLARLRPLDPETDTGYVAETVKQLVGELKVPLIGFAGAPFTVASYLIEGNPSRDHLTTKSLMFNNEGLWHSLLDKLADIAISSLISQVANGASAIQLFDSWAGALSVSQYKRFVAPHTKRIFDALEPNGVPRIHFGVNTGELLEQFVEIGADVVGIDWRIGIDTARARLGNSVPLQGNLDPAAVVAGHDAALGQTLEILRLNGGHPGHIFNLGHGVLPESDPGVLAAVAEVVHQHSLATSS